MIQLWQSVLSVVIPGVILAVIKRQLDWRGPRLVYYISGVLSQRIPVPAQSAPASPQAVGVQQTQPVSLNAYTLTIRNTGNTPARNIDISHPIWPLHHQVSPLLQYNIVPFEGQGPRLIRIHSLGPKESVSISYVYGAIQATRAEDILEYVRSEDGPAQQIGVILNQVYPKWFHQLVLLLCSLGLIFIGVIIWWLFPPLLQGIQWLVNFPRS